jgi:hypothetical protein
MAKSKKDNNKQNSDNMNITLEGNVKLEIKNAFSENQNEELNKYWRGIQREQLGISANIYMLFASAILAFVLHFLIEEKDNLVCSIMILLSIAIGFLIFSLGLYGWFTHNRLKDFRKTARYYRLGKKEKKVGELTRDIGRFTWNLYDIQRIFLFLGFIFSVIGICIFIYS